MKIKSEEYMQISEVSEMLGITPRTIRLYESLGLIDPPQRTNGRIRVYGNEDVVRLKFVMRLKVLGMSLEDMRELAQLYNDKKDLPKVISMVNELLEHHLREIRQKKDSLTFLETEIEDFRKKINGLPPFEKQKCSFVQQYNESKIRDDNDITDVLEF